MNTRFFIILGILLFTFGQFHVSEAFAYLDPGAGSAIIQGLIGALAGVLITLKIYWHRIREKLSRWKKTMINSDRETSSFRDPDGFLFYRNNILFRQINQSYKKNYEYLMDSGLYEKLTKSNMMIHHKESTISPFNENQNYKIIQPELIPFISYPFEWSFSQLKDAALLTLQIQIQALEFNMSLKDSSSYNIQFLNGKPIFIDTLSFEN